MKTDEIKNGQPALQQTNVRCRSDIRNEIKQKEQEINRLQEERIELIKEDILFSDEMQWFTETEEEHIISRRPKKVVKWLVGRRNWKETFIDEDTGNPFTADRTEIVRIDGEWK